MDPKEAIKKYQGWGEVLSEEQFNEIVQTGSIALLSMNQRSSYLWWLAKRRGLDPLTKPYDLIPDKKGKLIIYANRACSDQLRLNSNLTDEITFQGHPTMGDKLREDIYEVHVRLTDPDTKRVGEGIGCVATDGLTGEDYANAKMKCCHPKTQVLTENGWRYISQVTPNDKVAQLEGNELSFANPINVVSTQTDKYIRIEDTVSCQVVTPNHDVLLLDGTKIEAGDLFRKEHGLKRWRSAIDLPSVPATGMFRGKGLSESSAVIQLLAAFVSDGSYCRSEEQVQFGFSKVRKIERLEQLLQEATWAYTKHTYSVQHNERFKSEIGARTVFYVKSPAPWVFGHYLNSDKSLTMPTILSMSTEQANLFIDEIQHWDGYLDHRDAVVLQQKTGGLIDSIHTLCVTHGMVVSRCAIEQESDLAVGGTSCMTRIRVPLNAKSPRRGRRAYTLLPSRGVDAWCLTMPAGTILTRFDGKPAITGNCHTKALRRATLAFCGEGIPDESEVGAFAAPGAAPADVEVVAPPAASTVVKPKMLKPLPVAAPPVKVTGNNGD